MARPERLPDWEDRLHACLDAAAARPHDFGSHDCALFIADGVAAQTGHDFGAPFRGQYRSAAGAVRALRLHGAGTLIGTLTAALGPPKHVAHAGRGDVVTLEGGATGGIVMGAFAWVLSTDAGLIAVPRAGWRKAWTV